jgi:hypothetical protein
MNASEAVEDPVVFWIIVRDQYCCDECRDIHMKDGVPRVWKMSEVNSGYHKKGDDRPSVEGLHPHCRCQITTLLPGYGFNAAGFVTYKGNGWNEFDYQRGDGSLVKKSEGLM